MNKIILTIVVLAAAFATVSAQKNVAAAGREVKFESHAKAHYFENNDSGLKGSSSYLAFTSLEQFEQIFGYAAINGNNYFLPENVFDSKLGIAVIKRGNAIRKCDIKKVTVKNKELYVWYNVEPDRSSTTGTASYSTPSLLTVDKKNYTKVVFMENGKKVGTALVPKKTNNLNWL